MRPTMFYMNLCRGGIMTATSGLLLQSTCMLFWSVMARYFGERAAPAVWLGSCYRNHLWRVPVRLVMYRTKPCLHARYCNKSCMHHLRGPSRGTQMPGDQSPSAVSSDV